MSQFKNEPRASIPTGKMVRYTHQPLVFEHNGIHVKIQVNGKVTLSKVAETRTSDGEPEYDEIEIPASLVFKLANQLKITRTEEFVDIEKRG